LLQELETRFDMFRRKLKSFFGHMAGGAASAIAMNIREAHLEEGCSGGGVAHWCRPDRILGAGAHRRGERKKNFEGCLGFHIGISCSLGLQSVAAFRGLVRSALVKGVALS
jgi:hypothetical protein